MFVEKGAVTMNNMVDYELQNAYRYRRCLSVVMVWAREEPTGLVAFLQQFFRGSDLVMRHERGEAVLVLMGETDHRDAGTAIERLRTTCDRVMDLHFSLASYPRDGSDVNSIVSAAERRLIEATLASPGTVISAG